MPVTTLQHAMQAFDGGALGFRNAIINGDARVTQRGSVSVAAVGAAYGGADRIYVWPKSYTTVSGTLSQVESYGNSSSGRFQSFTVTTTGSGSITFGQRIEKDNCKHFSNKTITVSAKIYHDIGTSANVWINLERPSTTENDFSAVTNINSLQVGSISSGAYTTVSKTFSIVESNVQWGMAASISFNSLGAVTNKTFRISDFQVEVGVEATPFEPKPIGLELLQCMRYYQPLGEFNGNYISTTAVRGSIRYFVPMNAVPTLSAGTLQAQGVSNITISSPSLTNANYLAATFNGTVTGATAGQATRIVTTTGTSWLDAEL